MLIDTHCHINIMIKEKFDTQINATQVPLAQRIVKEAHDSEVTHIINIGTSVVESKNCIFLAQQIKNCSAVVGIHPNDCSANWLKDFGKIKSLLKEKQKNKIVGIGECGLDYHYPNHNKNRQKDAFKAHIELSLEHNLPLVIHTRDAGTDVLETLEAFKKENIKGVFHCFSENLAFADYAVYELKFFIGIGGPVTYPNNEKLRNVVKKVGLESILLETDAPYLPPQIARGKKNHPKYVRAIAEYLADLLKKDFSMVAHQTTENAKKLFELEIKS